MKNKEVLVILALVAALVVFDTASAQVGINTDTKATVTTQSTDKASVSATAEVKSEAAKPESSENDGAEVSAENKSEVALFVKELLRIADREKGIGAQVRVIAQEQEASSEKQTEAIAKVQARNKFMTFLFGSDYKNLGALRSEMVKTQNQIKQLEGLVVKAVSADARATLNAQIDVLKEGQVKLKSFIETNENAFSLFGWMMKKN